MVVVMVVEVCEGCGDGIITSACSFECYGIGPETPLPVKVTQQGIKYIK